MGLLLFLLCNHVALHFQFHRRYLPITILPLFNHNQNHLSLVSFNHGRKWDICFYSYYLERVDLLTNGVIFVIFSSFVNTLFLNYLSLWLFNAAL